MKIDNTIEKNMTVFPNIVEPSASLHTVARLLQRYDIRHLPVVENGRCIGLVHDKEILTVLKVTGLNAENEPIHTYMNKVFLTVPPEAVTRSVIEEMLKKKEDCAIILKDTKVMGIFTFFDAVKLLVHPS